MDNKLKPIFILIFVLILSISCSSSKSSDDKNAENILMQAVKVINKM